MLQLSEENLTQTLRRASEIAQGTTDTTSSPTTQEEYDAYLQAAEEVGIPREAMQQALRERFLIPTEAIKPGDVVFAPSADGALYAASVRRIESDASVVIAFLLGGEHRVTATDIRPLALVPGRKVQYEYDVAVAGLGGIWHNGKVLRYDPQTRQAEVAEGMMTHSVPLTKLRLQVETPRVPLRLRQILVRTALIAGGAGIGIGFLLGHFLH